MRAWPHLGAPWWRRAHDINPAKDNPQSFRLRFALLSLALHGLLLWPLAWTGCDRALLAQSRGQDAHTLVLLVPRPTSTQALDSQGLAQNASGAGQAGGAQPGARGQDTAVSLLKQKLQPSPNPSLKMRALSKFAKPTIARPEKPAPVPAKRQAQAQPQQRATDPDKAKTTQSTEDRFAALTTQSEHSRRQETARKLAAQGQTSALALTAPAVSPSTFVRINDKRERFKRLEEFLARTPSDRATALARVLAAREPRLDAERPPQKPLLNVKNTRKNNGLTVNITNLSRPVQVQVSARKGLLKSPPQGAPSQDEQGEGRLDAPASTPDAQQQGQSLDIQEIAAKVAQVLPLVYWKWSRRGELMGETTVSFRLNADGYVDQASLLHSSGDAQIDRDSSAALILASPFAYQPGWITLTLAFRG